ncbi:SAM-dependent methyltransferase, partial [Actinomadura sp. BRA 177]|nr:SAM-dependent methyltransferase [Actinomadura sp. BRA 177]
QRGVLALLGPGGRVLAEVDPPGTGARVEPLRLRSGRTVGEWFPWAHVPADAAAGLAASCAATAAEPWEEAGRWFVALHP